MTSPVSTAKRKREDEADDPALPAKLAKQPPAAPALQAPILPPLKQHHSTASAPSSSSTTTTTISVSLAPITGEGFAVPPAPLPSAIASAVLSMSSSSLPPSLTSSSLPLPFTSSPPTLPTLPLPSPTSSTSDPPPLPSPPEPSSALIALVDQFAHRLHLPPPHARLTLTLIHALVSQSTACSLPLHLNTSSNHLPWIACALWYSLLVLSPTPPLPPSSSSSSSSSSPSFTHILMAFNLPLPLFLRHLDHLTSHLQEATAALGLPTAGLQPRVQAFEAQLLISLALYKKYEKVYQACVRPEVAALEEERGGGEGEGGGTGGGVEVGGWSGAELFGCGWLLYLAVKAEAKKEDAHSLYVQLLAVCSFVLSAVVEERQQGGAAQQPGNDGVDGGLGGQRPGSEADAKARLVTSVRVVCTHGGQVDSALVLAVLQFHDEWLQRFMAELKAAGSVSYPALQSDVFSPSCLQGNITTMGHFLDSHTPADDADTALHLDERLFLLDIAPLVPHTNGKAAADDDGKANGKPAASHRRLFTDANGNGASSSSHTPPPHDGSSSPAPPPPSSSIYGTPLGLTSRGQPHHAFSPSLRSYLSSSHSSTRTPITRMMEAVSWLTTSFSSLSPAPSRTLLTYFSSLQPNPLFKLQLLISSLHSRVVIHEPDSTSSSSFSSSHTKRDLALRIYWLLVEHIATAQPPPPSQQPPAWLISRSFHAALLCICFELIFFAYRHTLLCFPHTLPLFGLSYFDYLKVVDTAMKRLPTLPTSLKTHLCEVEVSVVERRAWEPGEKAVDMMKDEHTRARVEAVMRAALHAASDQTGGTDKEEKGSSSNRLPLAGPMSPDLSALLSLYRKLCSLCADRLSYLSSDLALSLSTRLQQATWTLLLHVLFTHPSLLFHRHVDSLLLCSLYTIAVKICHAPLDFRRIVHAYLARWEGQAAHVVREVEGRSPHPPHPKLDIIAFYNDVFIGRIKDFALGTLQPILLAPLPSPSMTPLSPLPSRSRHGGPVHPHPNIFMSPMLPAVQAAQAAVATVQGVGGAGRVLSAVVGESPTKRLQEMNAMLEGRGAGDAGRGGGGGGGGRAGGVGSKVLFREDAAAAKRRVERDGVEALLLASRVNGHRDADDEGES